MQRILGKGTLSLSEQSTDQLRPMLAIGAYPFMKTPLPKCQASIHEDDLEQAREWNRQRVTEDMYESCKVHFIDSLHL
jgi:hypothetical protein